MGKGKKGTPQRAGTANVPKLRDILSRMWIEASTGHHHASIGAKLKEMLTSPAWDAAPKFFSYTLVAHFDAAPLGLTRLFDSTNGVVSRDALIRGADREAVKFAQISATEVRAALIPRIRNGVALLRPQIAPLMKRRNELLAHAAARYTLTDAEWGIAWPDLKKHYEQVMKLVNAVGTSFEGEKAMVMRGARESIMALEIKRVLDGVHKLQPRTRKTGK